MGLLTLFLIPFAVGQDKIKIDLPGIQVGKASGVAVNGNKAVRTFAGNGRSFTISGNENRITITGNAARVTVSGNKNTVTITGVGVIEVPGNENTVTWSRGLGKKPPRTSVLGNRNRVVGLP